MAKYASKVVEQAKAWLGLKESDGSFKVIIDTYNSQAVLPRRVKMQYNWEWCAAFVSAVAVKLGYTDIIPPECSCTKMIELLKKIGTWDERDDRVPSPGDLIFYNWEAAATGDDTTDTDHVGIVEYVKNGVITVIEGNYSQAVKRRNIPVNHRYIRGFGVPKYDTEKKKEVYTLEMRYLKKGCKGEDVRALQILLMGRGYSVGDSGADGDFGSATQSAVKRYQRTRGIGVDGVAGPQTMGSLLGV
ncbi:MAG: peptidoglycan-binding protein [Oscillospiraceae bacterium]|nr:peptidoglycan-binding protein [Oscillospiraceae bacterium]